MSATGLQIKTVHTLAKQAGLDDDTRRDLMLRETSRSSLKDMTPDEADRVISALKAIVGGRTGPRGAVEMSGLYAKQARALWISGYALGVIRDRTDAALLAFVRAQTGIDHLNWVREAAGGRAVVEALKKMLTREAGVAWNMQPKNGHGRKLAVYVALRQRLFQAGVDPLNEIFPTGWDARACSASELEALIKRGGLKLRAALKAKETNA